MGFFFTVKYFPPYIFLIFQNYLPLIFIGFMLSKFEVNQAPGCYNVIILFSNKKGHGKVKRASSCKFGDFSNCNLPLIYQMYRLDSISS